MGNDRYPAICKAGATQRSSLFVLESPGHVHGHGHRDVQAGEVLELLLAPVIPRIGEMDLLLVRQPQRPSCFAGGVYIPGGHHAGVDLGVLRTVERTKGCNRSGSGCSTTLPVPRPKTPVTQRMRTVEAVTTSSRRLTRMPTQTKDRCGNGPHPLGRDGTVPRQLPENDAGLAARVMP